MIELIFVIVILGILASVAVPRLAGTKADAEESAAVANLRTLVSDLNTYYVATGDIPTDTTWSQITNVPVDNPDKKLSANTSPNVGGKRCIDFLIKEATNTTPAYIIFAKYNGPDKASVCDQVQKSASLEPYFNSRVPGVDASGNNAAKGFMAIGSTTSIYDE